MNIVQRIRQANRGFEHHPAVIDGDRVCTYGQMMAQVDVLRRQFAELGIGDRDRVGFHCEDGLDYIVAGLALLATGAAIVPLAVSLTEAEIAQTIARMDVTGVVSQMAAINARACDLGEPVRVGDQRCAGEFLWRPRPAAADPPYALQKLDAAFIRFSSGTTGASKGIVLSHDTIYQRTEAADQGLQIQRDDRILWVLSMSHHFVVSILLFLRKGATIIIGHRDFPASVVEAARSRAVTFIYAAPFHYHLLAADPAITSDSLNRVRLAISTAMKLPPETAAAFQAKFGFAPAEAYGIIEVGLPFINLGDHRGASASVGRMLPAYELRLDQRDEQGVGEVMLRGPGMFDAYFSPWQWRDDCLDNGWFRTGDLGRLNEEEELELVGRVKTVIVCAGMKIFPDEVESVLNTHPQVRESLVFGVEHGAYGQIPQAAIVTNAPVEDPRELWRSLRRRCYASLSSYKVPKEFSLVRELPKTSSGKLRRHGPPPPNACG